MKERPIIFSGAMVRALLAGAKTQTRRVVKPQPAKGWAFEIPPVFGRITSHHPKKGRFGVFVRHGVGTDFPMIDLIPCPYGQPGGGGRLYVREAWAAPHAYDHLPPRLIPKDARIHYAATEDRGGLLWRPSIHMPRWASRITLEITSVRVERLQDISEADAQAEGWTRRPEVSTDPQVHKEAARDWFMDLWESINGPGSWEANPWVWVVDLRSVEVAAK